MKIATPVLDEMILAATRQGNLEALEALLLQRNEVRRLRAEILRIRQAA